MSYSSILEEIKRLSLKEQLALLESISQILWEELITPANNQSQLTASQIRRLPLEERQRILAQSARSAVPDYQPGSPLIEFSEALATEDFYDYEAR